MIATITQALALKLSYKSVEIARFDFITSWCAKEFCAVSCQDGFELWSDH